ncbi:MAG: L-2-amino-thiazoline-4-carboxylic acid hydrolase [Gammaproteobacteria bacterium]|nr:L-2-amino-thiazoline-4-carboxylic acid hydrolase [Gammaproteobacteria bacterium]MBU1489662.1 L-2-amino-thiazoline-4-carboxylic acid hydrolase [Gammaproteobacteria bacterium]MBU2067014.1 L-2-amino-thiazoline-4-carboxylic acid hydrolase [Gammaproteobacteria bacterium]MBU2137549.1 L-2-amino-thiazoline-4-carboxylic acid hydrolase [Gammaproteobacteria bacterium]MBU2216396.1 L-2-amino-thiazoline-4-carboxylic acid hydrolase [Gammaproteobacteria bacterium]
MKPLDLLLVYRPRIAFRRAAQAQLGAGLPATQAAAVWTRTLEIQDELQRTRVRHSPGVNLLLRYMQWDCALYRALQEQGISQQQACEWIEQINWQIFAPASAMAFRASRLRSRRLQVRIQWLLDVLFSLLFTRPFRRSNLPATAGVAFNVQVCPLASYLRDQGVPELTHFAACSLDYRMASDWGVTLQRTQTLAGGAAYCDFRFGVPPAQLIAREGASSDKAPSDQVGN